MSEASGGVRRVSRAPLGHELRVLSPAAPAWRHSALGMLASLPWCCVLPAGLASLGLASSLLAHWLQHEPYKGTFLMLEPGAESPAAFEGACAPGSARIACEPFTSFDSRGMEGA